MGAAQAAGTVYSLLKRRQRQQRPRRTEKLRERVHRTYQEQTDIRYGAARGWIDAIIQPHETRAVLAKCLDWVSRPMPKARFHSGVMQT